MLLRFVRHFPEIFRWQLALVFLAVGLIFWQLGVVPRGMTVDEAAIGYNGYAVLTTRRDEWLHKLPISFRSFGDYKAPLAIYLNGFFTYSLGMELWVVRLPFAVAGVLSVVMMIKLLQRLYSLNHPLSSWSGWTPATAALVGGGILVTTPWFLHYVRTGFESGLALFFLLVGIFTLTFLLDSAHKKYTWVVALITSSALVASMYTYHSAKVVAPLMALALVVIHYQAAIKRKAFFFLTAGLSAFFLLPLVIDQLLGEGGQRFQQTTIFGKSESEASILLQLLTNLAAHLDPRFLMGGLTTTLRHGDGQWGVLLPVVFGFWILGLVSFFFWRKNHGTQKLWWVGFIWTVIGLAPAVVGSEVPHSNRALLALPGFIITSLLGLEFLGTRLQYWRLNRKIKGSHGEKNMILKTVIGTLFLLHLFFFVTYLHHYYTDFAQTSAPDYKEGYLEVYNFIVPYEKGTNGYQTDKILFTNEYGQPYIYALFVRQTNPIYYQGGSLIKYEFTDFLHTSDLDRPHTIVVTAPADGLPIERATKVIKGSDGQPRFLIYINDTHLP